MSKKSVVALLVGAATVALLLIVMNQPDQDGDIEDGPDQPAVGDGSGAGASPQIDVPRPVPEFQFVDQSGEEFGLEDAFGISKTMSIV